MSSRKHDKKKAAERKEIISTKLPQQERERKIAESSTEISDRIAYIRSLSEDTRREVLVTSKETRADLFTQTQFPAKIIHFSENEHGIGYYERLDFPGNFLEQEVFGSVFPSTDIFEIRERQAVVGFFLSPATDLEKLREAKQNAYSFEWNIRFLYGVDEDEAKRVQKINDQIMMENWGKKEKTEEVKTRNRLEIFLESGISQGELLEILRLLQKGNGNIDMSDVVDCKEKSEHSQYQVFAELAAIVSRIEPRFNEEELLKQFSDDWDIPRIVLSEEQRGKLKRCHFFLEHREILRSLLCVGDHLANVYTFAQKLQGYKNPFLQKCGLEVEQDAQKVQLTSVRDILDLVEKKDGAGIRQLKDQSSQISADIAQVGAIIAFADLVKRDGYAKASFDETKEESFKAGWHFQKKKKPEAFSFRDENKKPQVPNDSMADVPVAMLTGDIMSGKSFQKEVNEHMRRVAQSFGYVPAAEGNFHIYDAFVSIDRAQTDHTNDLSAFGKDMKNFLDALAQIDSSQRVFLVTDEWFSTTSPEDQRVLLYAVIQYLLSRGVKLVVANHNDLFVSDVEGDEQFRVYHLATEKQEDASIVFTYKLEEGRAPSHIIDIAEQMGLPISLVASARNYMNGNIDRREVKPLRVKPLERLSETERSLLKTKTLRMEEILPQGNDILEFRYRTKAEVGECDSEENWEREIAVAEYLRTGELPKSWTKEDLQNALQNQRDEEVERENLCIRSIKRTDGDLELIDKEGNIIPLSINIVSLLRARILESDRDTNSRSFGGVGREGDCGTVYLWRYQRYNPLENRDRQIPSFESRQNFSKFFNCISDSYDMEKIPGINPDFSRLLTDMGTADSRTLLLRQEFFQELQTRDIPALIQSIWSIYSFLGSISESFSRISNGQENFHARIFKQSLEDAKEACNSSDFSKNAASLEYFSAMTIMMLKLFDISDLNIDKALKLIARAVDYMKSCHDSRHDFRNQDQKEKQALKAFQSAAKELFPEMEIGAVGKSIETMIATIENRLRTVINQPLNIFDVSEERLREAFTHIGPALQAKVRFIDEDNAYHLALSVFWTLCKQDAVPHTLQELRSGDSVYTHQMANALEEIANMFTKKQNPVGLFSAIKSIAHSQEWLAEDRWDRANSSPKWFSPHLKKMLREYVIDCMTILRIGEVIKDAELCPVQFHDTAEIVLGNAWNPAKERDNQVRNSFIMNDSNRVSLNTGPNMSGKTFSENQKLWSIFMAHATGFAFADEARMPVLDGVFFMDRIQAKTDENLSAGGTETKAWMDIFSQIKPDGAYVGIFDESWSTVPPREQSALTYAVCTEFLGQNAFVTVAHHNHDFIRKLLEMHPDTTHAYHLMSHIDEKGVIQFDHRMQPGHRYSEALEVAKKMGMPPEILEIANKLKRR